MRGPAIVTVSPSVTVVNEQSGCTATRGLRSGDAYALCPLNAYGRAGRRLSPRQKPGGSYFVPQRGAHQPHPRDVLGGRMHIAAGGKGGTINEDPHYGLDL